MSIASAFEIIERQIAQQAKKIEELEKTLTEHDELLNGEKNKEDSS